VLKFIFWLLAGVNLLVFAMARAIWAVSAARRTNRAPAQPAAGDKLTMLTQEQARRPRRQPPEETAAAPAVAPPLSYACTEVAISATTRAALRRKSLASRRNAPPCSEPGELHGVHPPQGSKEGADRKAGELRAAGRDELLHHPMKAARRAGAFHWASSRRKAARRPSWHR
jgi:hypothetical protein